ncbi:hypothetical protein [Thiomonas delicata]|uniref:Putative Urocanate hydratase n=1 Tax=Thiomonas delicata TaxID=364030 RepID=A0A238CZG1_THIDL|nr:hypothetical protein [Thiomonas delicata]SBP86383.1 putative Urocanate hydratase [Thiomonas delicata]
MNKKTSPQSANVTFGTLLSRQELQQEFNTLKQLPTATSHALYATLPDAIVRHLESALLPQAAALGIARSPGGIICAVLTTQAGSTQVRFIVPLLTDKAKTWLTEAAEEKHQMQCALDIVETHQLALVQVINPLAGDSRGQWPAVKAMLDKPMPTVDVASQAQELVSLVHILAGEGESLLPIFSIQEVWYVLVDELPPPPAPGSASNPSTALH